MTPAAEILAAGIRRSGPVRFDRFMQVALYHPEHGYYTRARERFGAAGDFYTAEQVQPTFGILIRGVVRAIREELGMAEDFTVVELGAGRREMAPALAEFHYVPVEVSYGQLPPSFAGAVFANEFFDALPVRVFARRGAAWIELRVDHRGGGVFAWVDGEAADEAALEELEGSPLAGVEGARQEVCLEAVEWMRRISTALERGRLVAIDYGNTTRELIRFPAGTLMAYRRHQALEDVLEDPGDRDITSHVNFSSLLRAAANQGWRETRLESLAQLLLAAGRADEFQAALEEGLEPGAAETELHRRLQLKTLLFGMGETYRVLTAARGSRS